STFGLPGLLGVSSPHAAPVGGPVRPRLRARGPVHPRLRARPPRPVSGPDARFVSSSRGSGRTHLSAARRPQGHDLTGPSASPAPPLPRRQSPVHGPRDEPALLS